MQSSTRSGFLFGLVAGTLFLFVLAASSAASTAAPGRAHRCLERRPSGCSARSAVGSYLGTRYLPNTLGGAGLELDSPRPLQPGQAVVAACASRPRTPCACRAARSCSAATASSSPTSWRTTRSNPSSGASRASTPAEAVVVPAAWSAAAPPYLSFRFALPNELLPTTMAMCAPCAGRCTPWLTRPISPFTAQREIVVRSPEPACPNRAPNTVHRLARSASSASTCPGDLCPGRAGARPRPPDGPGKLRRRRDPRRPLRVESTLGRRSHRLCGGGSGYLALPWRARPGGQGTPMLDGGEHILSGRWFHRHRDQSVPRPLISREWRPTFTTKDGRVLWKVA